MVRLGYYVAGPIGLRSFLRYADDFLAMAHGPLLSPALVVLVLLFRAHSRAM